MLLFNQKVLCKSVLITSCLLFFGCTGGKDPLGIYKITQLRFDAEAIFRRENAVVSEVMILTMDEENSTLAAAEQEMTDACAELNAYAIRIRDKLGDDLAAKQRVLNTLDQCEAATSHLESLVQSGNY